MIIAVVNETSAGDKNSAVVNALMKHGTIINAGMKKSGGDPELTYIETGLLSALLLNAGRADLVVGGCGTGQGYLNSVMQYPGVFCGLIESPLDGWLFRRINGGNCISLALNKGYGWAGDVNLEIIFDYMFKAENGSGFPEHRAESQAKSRNMLTKISASSHISFDKILKALDPGILKNTLTFPGVREIIDVDSLAKGPLKETITELYMNL